MSGWADGGDAQDVRMFNEQHINGLEFEAVFFLSVDRPAERCRLLFDRYLLVGVSRAARYLGITCESSNPRHWSGGALTFFDGCLPCCQ